MKNVVSFPLNKGSLIRKWSIKSALLVCCCLLFATNVQAQQQQMTVSGEVVDEKGESIIGATISVTGSTKGTITDAAGKFSITAPSNGVLKVSYLGHASQSIRINKQASLSIVLTENTSLLDEVVVIGYGTMKRKDLTGAVSSLKNEDVTIAPTSNVMEALQGKISGMDIVKSTGKVGEDVEILLRGTRSIYGSNRPLFIIDGIPGSYSQVNPSDIESVDVLKDASSTAIYGSAGSNGVIIITTKRGKEGKTRVNFDAYLGFSGTPEFFHGMVGDEWTAYQKEAYKFKNGQYPADMSSILTDASKLEAYNQGKWIDWVDEASGNTAVNQKYSLSVTGGTARTKVFSSLSYDKQEGLLENENQNKYAVRLNIDQEIFSWAKVGFINNLTYAITNSGVKNTFTKALSAFPLGDVRDATGELVHEYATNEYSPLGDFIKNQFVDNTRSFYANSSAYLEITPLPGLSMKTIVSTTLDNGRRGQFWGSKANALRPTYAGVPHASITNNYGYSYMWDNILNYNKTFLKDHDLGVTLVTSWTKSQDESNMAAGSGQNMDSWSFYRLMGAVSQHVESDYNQNQKMSYAARLNYSYKGRYLFTASMRKDGVSYFSKGHKWDSFPAAALGWRISEESFMSSTQGWLNNLKLRLGYGVTGNSGGVKAYYTSTVAQPYSNAGISLDGQIVPFTQYSGTYGSATLGWEKSYNLNIGLDFGLLNNRIDGSIEWFSTQTKDLLYKRTMPVTSGITGWGSPLASWENIAETSNKGVEITLNTRNIQTKEFSWNSTVSFTWSRDKIESLPTGDLIADALFEGESVRSLYGYKYAGIWGSTTSAETLAAYGVKPGMVMIETVPQQVKNAANELVSDNGVHKYSEKDRFILGHSNPDYIVGFNNTFAYKGFDLSVFAMARYGQTIKSDLLGWYTAKTENQIAGVDYWTESNQSAYFPIAGSGSEQAVMSALQYRDGSFIKVKNITLGYTLPLKISQVAKMERCRLYATAYNPFLYVKDKQLKGTDPESGGSDSFPLYKQFVVGLNITF